MRTQMQSRSTRGAMLLLALVVMAGSSFAQYFGRNKVQYEDFDFKELRTTHFKVYYYPEESTAVFDAARMLERWYERLSGVFRVPLKKTQPVILYANHADFQQTNVIGGLIPQGVGGVTEGLANRVVIPLTGVYAENDHVLGHELAHAFHYDIMKSNEGGLGASRGIPLWFIEGMSEYLSIGRKAPLTSMWMRDALVNDDLASIEEASSDPRYFPYRYGHAIWAYIAGAWGDQAVATLYSSVLAQGFSAGVEAVLGISVDSLSKQWHAAVEDAYRPDLRGRVAPAETGTRVVVGQGGTNLSPVISPNGKYFAYLSQKDIFSLDLYLADAKTGKNIKKLVETNTDAHFDALRFMNSAGAWSPDSRYFAFVVFKDGDNALAILDVKTDRVGRTRKIPGIDAINYIAWSPDGEEMVLSATQGAISNLYLYRRDGNKVQQLTDDRYAEIQPAWSPDGKKIAFVTDDGPETDFDKLVYGPMSIMLMDLETGERRRISTGPEAVHTTPQFAGDNKNIFFVADPDGVSNIYRYDMESGEFFRITNVSTGVSGLTELSPALSVAADIGRVAFTVFDNTEYAIHTMSASDLYGEPFNPDTALRLAQVVLPPASFAPGVDANGNGHADGNGHDSMAVDDSAMVTDSVIDNVGMSYVSNYLLSPKPAELVDSMVAMSDYSPSLRLLHIGQVFLGVATDGSNVGLGGGISMLFGDLLGNHQLGVAAQMNGSLQDFGAQVEYVNLSNRFNWALRASHIPYLTTRSSVSGSDLDPNAREITLLQERVFSDRFVGAIEYPLSQNRRFEFSTGYTRLWFTLKGDRYTVVENEVVDQEELDPDDPPPLDMWHGGTAYVGDFSFSAFTSPVKGRRFRFEVEPTLGSLMYASVLLDYRHYFFLNPVTLAVRAMHFGRYWRDSEDDRLSSLNVGYESLIRGYSPYSFDVSECIQNESGEPVDCPKLERLYGSRIALMNTELRLPLLGTEEFGLFSFRYLPTTLVAFADGGVAWRKGRLPKVKISGTSDDRIPVFSAGGAARLNLFGVLVMQIYSAYPFQRPDAGWEWGLVLAPGY